MCSSRKKAGAAQGYSAARAAKIAAFEGEAEMNRIRRSLLAALALSVLKPLHALAAWNKDAFGAKTPADAMKSLGMGSAAPSKDIVIEAPQIAENGAVVPIEVSSNIPGTTALVVLI